MSDQPDWCIGTHLNTILQCGFTDADGNTIDSLTFCSDGGVVVSCTTESSTPTVIPSTGGSPEIAFCGGISLTIGVMMVLLQKLWRRHT